MPIITKAKYLDALRAKLAAGPSVTAAELNAPQKVGETVGAVQANQAVKALSAATLAGIEAQTLLDAPTAADKLTVWQAAVAWYDHLATGSIDLGTGTQGRAVVDALVAGGLMTAAERAALIALATTDIPGPSWAESAGLGYVYPENLEQAKEVG